MGQQADALRRLISRAYAKSGHPEAAAPSMPRNSRRFMRPLMCRNKKAYRRICLSDNRRDPA